jgi:hypothetical protein
MVGPARHGDACCRESPALATFPSLSSFLTPTWEPVEGLTTPTAGARTDPPDVRCIVRVHAKSKTCMISRTIGRTS